MSLQFSGLSPEWGGASPLEGLDSLCLLGLCLRLCGGSHWWSFSRRVLRSGWAPDPQGLPVRWAVRPAWQGPCSGCGGPEEPAGGLGKVLGCADCPPAPLPWRASWAVGVPGDRSSRRGFRQALVDHYSKLSAEAARREQKALWKIQRHRLAGARLRFLLEDQERMQVPLRLLACGALGTPDTARTQTWAFF